jgi:hypothetical protein
VDNIAQISLLTSVAGAGKSAIAHTVTLCCNEDNLISSSFFFDQEVSGRNDSRMLFTMITCDLANQNDNFAQQVTDALNKKKSLIGASKSVHFAELILKPSRHLPVNRPVVIIINALDEGYDLEVLKILHNEVPKLPGIFCILITSHMVRGLGLYLLKEHHVHPLSIDIEDHTNLQDITLYAHHRLQEVVDWGYHLMIG